MEKLRAFKERKRQLKEEETRERQRSAAIAALDPEAKAKSISEFVKMANQYIQTEDEMFQMGFTAYRSTFLVYQEEPDNPASVTGQRAYQQSLRRFRSPRIFRAVFDPQLRSIQSQVREAKMIDLNWVSDSQQFAAEVLDLLAAEPSSRKQKALALGFQEPDRRIQTALQQIVKNDFLERVDLKPMQLVTLLLDPLVLPAQAYLLADNLRESLTLPEATETDIFFEAMLQFGKHHPQILNSLGLVGPKVSPTPEQLSQLLALANKAPADVLHPLVVLPFFTARLAEAEHHLLAPIIKKSLLALTFHASDQKLADLPASKMPQLIESFERADSASVLIPLIQLLDKESSLAERTRLLAHFVLIALCRDSAVLEDLFIVFNQEFGQQKCSQMAGVIRALQLGAPGTPADSPSLPDFLEDGRKVPSLIKDGLLNAPETLHLLDADAKVSFLTPAAGLLKVNLATDRVTLNAISRRVRGLSIGEHEALNAANVLVEPLGFVSHTDPAKFAEKVGGSDFENTFQYLSAVRHQHQSCVQNFRSDSLAQAAFKGRALKGFLFTRTLSRRFSSKPEKEGWASPQPSIPEGAAFRAKKNPTFNSAQRESSWKRSLGSSRPNRDLELLLQSDVTDKEFAEKFAKILEAGERDVLRRVDTFETIFRYPGLVGGASLAAESQDSNAARLSHAFFDPHQGGSSSLVFQGETRLGAMPLDLNHFSPRHEFRGLVDRRLKAELLDSVQGKISHTQYFILLNLHITEAPRDPELAVRLVNTCVERRWPKALIQTLYLLLQNQALTSECLALGLQHLSRFRFMASEGVDIFVAYLKSTQDQKFDPAPLGEVLDSMIDCGQVADAFFRFEDIKNALQALRYAENPKLSPEENENASAEFKAQTDAMRQKLYSTMFDLAVRHNVTQQAILLFAEMMNTKAFKTTQDAENLLRYGRRAQSEMNTCLTYIKEEMKYAENRELVFPPEFVTEWLEVFRAGPADLARNATPLLNMFFMRFKTPLKREHLSGVLKMVLVHQNHNVLNTFLEFVARDKKAAKELGENAKEGILAVISRSSSEDLRAEMISKVDRIFQVEQDADPNQLSAAQKLMLRASATQRFVSVWESRLEKYEERVFEPTEKHRPRKRPLKDKRSFLRQTFDPMVEAEIAAARQKENFDESFDVYPWMKERKEVIREIKEAEKYVDAHRKAELSQGLYADYDHIGTSEGLEDAAPQDKKKKQMAQMSAFKDRTSK